MDMRPIDFNKPLVIGDKTYTIKSIVCK